MRSNSTRTFYLSALAVFVADQFSKYIVSTRLPENASLRIFSFFHLTNIRNRGICFGLLRQQDFIPLLIVISFVVLACIVVRIHRRGGLSPLSGLGFGLVAGGILGNLLDRIRLHAVVDFIDMRVWPVFNVADSCIVCGVFLLILLQMGRHENVPCVPENR